MDGGKTPSMAQKLTIEPTTNSGCQTPGHLIPKSHVINVNVVPFLRRPGAASFFKHGFVDPSISKKHLCWHDSGIFYCQKKLLNKGQG